MKRFLGLTLCCLVLAAGVLPAVLQADEIDFRNLQNSFNSFLRCEMIRGNGGLRFNNKPFEVVETHVDTAVHEGNTFVVTGTIVCWVDKKNVTLFAALGVKAIMGHKQVAYLDIRTSEFSILASELAGFPYTGSCAWIPYWVDRN